jgi:hypothetical protein
MAVPACPAGARVARWLSSRAECRHQDRIGVRVRRVAGQAARVTSSIKAGIGHVDPTAAAVQLSAAGVERTSIDSLSRLVFAALREIVRRHAVVVGLKVAGASGA